jgi:hypothetical protein
MDWVIEDTADEGLTKDQFDDLFYMIPMALFFAEHDVDGSGALDKTEIGQLLKTLDKQKGTSKMGLRATIKVSSPHCRKHKNTWVNLLASLSST